MSIKKKGHPGSAPLSVYKRGRDSIFLSGQIGLDKDGVLVAGGPGPETRQILNNIQEILSQNFGRSVDLNNALKIMIYITDTKDYEAMNNVYKTFWVNNNYPARTCVVVKDLWAGASVAIDGEFSIDT